MAISAASAAAAARNARLGLSGIGGGGTTRRYHTCRVPTEAEYCIDLGETATPQRALTKRTRRDTGIE
jgi:hypothetical protein